MPILLAIAIVLAYGFCQQPAWADVYAYTTSTGTVNLSNVQMDSGYSVLLQDPAEQVDNEPVEQAAVEPADLIDLVRSDEIALVPVEKTSMIPDTCNGRPSFSISDKAIYDKMVNEVARLYGVESALLHAVISVESRYSPRAVSKKGALGLMQLMPVTARRYGVIDPLDPVQNLHGGAKYLRHLLRKYNNDRNLALAAYNAGEGTVAKYGNRIPPYRETTNYVPRVMGYYRKYMVKG
jgi:soluble lytic murein transglycosylase-like protein